MSSLTEFNSSEAMSFLALSIVFLFVSPAIFVGIVAMWANLKQKISYELTKIAYESIDSAVGVSEINDKSTAEINKIKNEISNFTAEIKARDNAFSSEMNGISASLNTIASKLSEIEKTLEQHHNNFCEISTKLIPINTSIEILQNDMAQRYAVVRRTQLQLIRFQALLLEVPIYF